MRLSTLTLLLTILLLSCSGGESRKTTNQAGEPNQAQETAPAEQTDESAVDPGPANEIQFEWEVPYGSTDEVVVGSIAAFVVDKQNRVFIADGGETNIKVFNPDGSYLTSIGRQGQGPGEFSAFSQFITTMAIRSNMLYVTDGTKGYELFPTRVQIFSLKDLSFSHTMKLMAGNRHDYQTELKGYYPKQMYPLTNGRFLVAYHRSQLEYKDTQSFIQYVIQDGTAKIISDPILKQQDLTYLVYTYPGGVSQTLYSFAFFGKSLLAISNDDHLYTAWTE